jgi:cobalt/nickel transport system ATP-binding protein
VTRGGGGLVFQDPDDQLFSPTVFDDVAFGPMNMGLTREEVAYAVSRALEEVGVTGQERRPAHHLSYGQKKRVAMATVLSMNPDMLVLDEPSSNLDPRARREFSELLQGMRITKILVTHDLPFVFENCNRVVVMSEGKVAANGEVFKILSDEELLAAHGLELPFGFYPTPREKAAETDLDNL